MRERGGTTTWREMETWNRHKRKNKGGLSPSLFCAALAGFSTLSLCGGGSFLPPLSNLWCGWLSPLHHTERKMESAQKQGGGDHKQEREQQPQKESEREERTTPVLLLSCGGAELFHTRQKGETDSHKRREKRRTTTNKERNRELRQRKG